MKHLTREHGRVLELFSEHPHGYLVEWPPESSIHEWYFNFNDVEGSGDITADTEVCKDLKEIKVIKPILNDIEYTAQIAIGTQHYKIYRMADIMKNIFNIDFINYLEKNSIIWM